MLNTAKQQLISTSTHRYDAHIMVEVTGHLPESLSELAPGGISGTSRPEVGPLSSPPVLFFSSTYVEA